MPESPLESLSQVLTALVEGLCAQAHLEPPKREAYAWAPPKNPAHGDYATNAGLLLAKPLGRPPVEIAEQLAAALRVSPLLAGAEVAKPGFVNVRLSAAAVAEILDRVREEGDDFGDAPRSGKRVLLEFISANPTGPMHVGHLRHAATGDAVGRILDAAGWHVYREFYINDAGNQIGVLGRSFRVRCYQALGDETAAIEEGMYPGLYLAEMAREFVERGHKTREQLDAMTEAEFAWEARNRCMAMIERHLAELGVGFDAFVSEKALYERGAVRDALERLKGLGMTYEKDGALWLNVTGDDAAEDEKDRVLVKSDGTLTYVVPDLAYHHDKFLRGFDRYINIFGSDHIGYVPRLKAGIRALGHNADLLDVLVLRLVFLVSEGERVRGSKRKGTIVEATELAHDVGMDVVRWFLLQRSTDSEIEFDVDLAKEHSDRNPVFKVQYAHARIHSLFVKAKGMGLAPAASAAEAAPHLSHGTERDLLLHLAAFPGEVLRAAEALAPHHLTNYLLALAELWNRYWSAAKTDESLRIVVPEATARSGARLLLAGAVRQTIANGLQLLGINAPERLAREEAEG